jgi:hypothetical protein
MGLLRRRNWRRRRRRATAARRDGALRAGPSSIDRMYEDAARFRPGNDSSSGFGRRDGPDGGEECRPRDASTKRRSRPPRHERRYGSSYTGPTTDDATGVAWHETSVGTLAFSTRTAASVHRVHGRMPEAHKATLEMLKRRCSMPSRSARTCSPSWRATAPKANGKRSRTSRPACLSRRAIRPSGCSISYGRAFRTPAMR